MICYQLLNQLSEYTPKSTHFTTTDECKMIIDTLKLKEASSDDLQNLRDFCVMMWSDKLDRIPDNDRDSFTKTMSAMQSITSVIDHFQYGMTF